MKTLEELKEELLEINCDTAIVFENPDFASAAIGTDEDGRVVYDYDKMVECLAAEDNMSMQDAADTINYQTIQSLPNMGEMRPIILTKFHEYK